MFVNQFDDYRWPNEDFRMAPLTFYQVVERLSLAFVLVKNDTHWRLVIAIEVKVVYVLYIIPAHVCSFVVCRELFAIGKLTLCLCIKQVIKTINIVFNPYTLSDGIRPSPLFDFAYLQIIALFDVKFGRNLIVVQKWHMAKDAIKHSCCLDTMSEMINACWIPPELGNLFSKMGILDLYRLL